MWPERPRGVRILPESRFRLPDCERLQRRPPARNQHWAEAVTRPQRILNIATWIAAALTAGLGILQTFTGDKVLYIGLINLSLAGVFLAIPWLHRFGNLVAAMVFVIVSYASLTFVGTQIGTDSGVQFYFLVSASLAVLVLGVDHLALAGIVVAVGAGLVIYLQFMVPGDTGLQPRWALYAGFIFATGGACLLMLATVWYAMREVTRA